MSEIVGIHAREILDSRGYPTVETDVYLESGIVGRAAIPSGKSTGIYEAVELRDGDKNRYHGKGVMKAVANVNEQIAEAVIGIDSLYQEEIDRIMIEIDGTENKGKLGANAILSVSLAVARASSLELGIPLYRYLGGLSANTLPVPQFNILNGGAHADSGLAIQEFLIIPAGLRDFPSALQAGSEVYHTLEKLLKKEGYSTSVGDEGGFAPRLSSCEDAIKFIIKAIEESGYAAGREIFVGVDSAASSFFTDKGYNFEGKILSAKDMIDYYEYLVSNYRLISIEDGLAEEDWEGWILLNKRLGARVQLTGDDIFVTNINRIKKGIELRAANSVLIKLNQIGTLTETIQAVQLAKLNCMTAVVSHRSGETADSFISHLVVGLGNHQIKTGAPCRVERIEKYNEILRIHEELEESANFAGLTPFARFLQ